MKRTLSVLIALAFVLTTLQVQPAAAQTTTYTVKSGDNLYQIALKHGTTVDAIMQANGLTSTIIIVGQVLIIPTGGAAPPAATPKPAANPGTYTVLAGDNLYRISLKFSTTVEAIQSLNGLTSTVIFVGQVLKIPGAGTTTATATPKPGTTSAPAPTSSAIPGTYVVQPGDNLYRLAIKFDTTVEAIQSLNGLTSTVIFVGQVLKIPGGSPSPTATSAPAATAVPGATATKTPTPVPTGTGGAGFELGGQVASFSRPDLMLYAGMAWVKQQVRWAPASKATDFTNVITDAHNKGFKVLLSVLGDPQYATSGNFPAFASFVGDLAAAGADGIEVWNEMNIDREWPSGQINATNYLPLLQQSYNAIKARNSNTLVVSGAPAPTGFYGGCSPTGCDDAPYINALIAAGGLNYMDCLGAHYNEGVISPTQTSGDPRGNPNHYTRYYQTMVDTYYNAAGGKKKLCFTELGYLSGQEWGYVPAGFVWLPPYNLTVAQQAQYLADATRLSRDQGKVRLMIIFNVDLTAYNPDPQAGYAMIRPGGSCPACDSVHAVTGGR